MLCLYKENNCVMPSGAIEFLPATHFAASVGSFIEDANPDKLFVLSDSGSHKHCRSLLSGASVFDDAVDVVISSGEGSKSLASLQQVWHELSNGLATRHSMLVNLGGGMVTDLGGFAAAAFKRGMRFVNIPTTLLAVVDASIGGKTGINFNGMKNEIGVFANPLLTVIHLPFLATLPEPEMRSGFAEMLKHALLDSNDHLAAVIDIDPAALASDACLPLIRRSIGVKQRIVAIDKRENGMRAALNFGHTAGHAFEELSLSRGKPVPHGYAVAWGMACELYLSVALSGFPVSTLRQVTSLVNEMFGRMDFTCGDYEEVYAFMLHDKKNYEGKINFVLLDDVGKPRIGCNAGKELVFESFDFLREGI